MTTSTTAGEKAHDAATDQRAAREDRHRRLGSNAVSAAMTGKFAGRAEGDATALSPLVDQYRDLVLQTRDAVDTATAAYHVTEEGTAGDLGRR